VRRGGVGLWFEGRKHEFISPLSHHSRRWFGVDVQDERDALTQDGEDGVHLTARRGTEGRSRIVDREKWTMRIGDVFYTRVGVHRRVSCDVKYVAINVQDGFRTDEMSEIRSESTRVYVSPNLLICFPLGKLFARRWVRRH
jgi:hypothetical protein